MKSSLIKGKIARPNPILTQIDMTRELRGTFVTLGFSYGFGKGETMEYLGQRRRF